ncbi:hypothetical protein J7382_11915 [Shimia sp. R11_0]|uniref:hypothetical protein n=1 Tax=Shimia sp. R11_0 TaxID=2821096 RepID=UPI001ADBBB58|nr:hypothetical protein [Shimia sp. R11_0]MBO9478242.1 hypothetical protein [Shimia sp. R11_0]
MALTLNTKPNPSARTAPSITPYLTPKQVATMTGGALTEGQLKQDRMEAEANGTPPKIPYYRISYRKVHYKPDDVRAYLETLRVE